MLVGGVILVTAAAVTRSLLGVLLLVAVIACALPLLPLFDDAVNRLGLPIGVPHWLFLPVVILLVICIWAALFYLVSQAQLAF